MHTSTSSGVFLQRCITTLPSTAARPSLHWVICNLCPHLPCWAALFVWVLPETEALGRNRHRKQTADRRQRRLHNLRVFTERSRMAHSRATRLWPEVMLWGQKDLLFKLQVLGLIFAVRNGHQPHTRALKMICYYYYYPGVQRRVLQLCDLKRIFDPHNKGNPDENTRQSYSEFLGMNIIRF